MKNVTIKMVAEKAGVSIAAVSKAMNQQPGIGPEKAAKVRKIAEDMGYYPNAAAQTLKTNRSRNIGIVYHNKLEHMFFSQVLEGIRSGAEEKDYDLTFLTGHDDSGISYYEHAMRRQCDGIIIAQGFYNPEDLKKLAESSLPLVSIDQQFTGHTAIVNDNIGSTEEIVHYLYKMGHRRIAMIHGEDGTVTNMRINGFLRGCHEMNVAVPDGYIQQAKYQEPRDSGLATRKLLSMNPRPTCILYPDDISYLGGLTEIERSGLTVPDDISCFGYDGIRLAELYRPKLSTYQQDAEMIGRTASQELISAIEYPKYYEPRIISITGRIQEGQTVKDLKDISKNRQ